MEINKFKINWLNIIIKQDFIQYLESDLLKEVALISKLVRDKLKPQLFRNVELSTNNYYINFKDNLLVELLDYCINSECQPYSYRTIKHRLKILDVESSLKDFMYSLKDVKIFTKNFYFDEMERAEYYLFPIISIFENLTSLRLNRCFIPLIEFYKLGESLSSLKNIKLVKVTFVKLHKEKIKIENIKFPHRLTHLDIYYCRVVRTKLPLNPVNFFFSKNTELASINYTLPYISIPSLKNLSLIENVDNNTGVKTFLSANPNLHSLNIETFDMSIIQKLNSLDSLEFGIIEHIDTRLQAPALKGVRKLKIGAVYFGYFKNIMKLCSLCPNLQEVRFDMTYTDQVQYSINNFLSPIFSNLYKLKFVRLILNTKYEEGDLDITKFSNIESIEIKVEISTIFNLNFYNCKNLKKLKFTSYTRGVNTQEFKEKFSSYKNWIFKFNENTISGYKL
jgi:hypothetical protein